MTTAFYLAAEDGESSIQVGHYTKFELFGLTFNLETIIATRLRRRSCSRWRST